MFLKFLPKDVDLGALVQMTIFTTQSTLMRVQEIQDIESRKMTKSEIVALQTLRDVLALASRNTETALRGVGHAMKNTRQ